MTSFFNFATQPVDVEIKLTGDAERRQVEVKGEKDKKETCPVFYDGESVIGQVSAMVPKSAGSWTSSGSKGPFS